MIEVIIGCTIAAGGGYWFFNKKTNKDSQKVAVNNFVYITNLIYERKPTSFAIRDNHPTLVFDNVDIGNSISRVEIKFDANCNLQISYRTKNEDHNTDFFFSNFDREKVMHTKCIYKNYSKVDISDTLFLNYAEYCRKMMNQVFYALSVFSVSNEEMPIFNTILSSFDINHPEDYIQHFLSGSKVLYQEEKVDMSELITTSKLFEFIDFKLVGDNEIDRKFDVIEQTTSEILKHQKLLSIDSMHYITRTLPETLTEALAAYVRMNDKVKGSEILHSIFDNVIVKLNSLNEDKDEFYLEKLKNLSSFSEQKKK